MVQFRDPVHGFIDVTEDELKIINSAPFQRLRFIRQLATTYLVYHGAEHTRFGHSLGVMHLTSRVFDSVVAKVPNVFSDDREENEILCKWYRQILRLIGLTHDLGHAPFSHASEELFAEGRKHEDYTKEIIYETEIAAYINEIGLKFQREYGEAYKITPEIIWLIYEGKKITDDEFVMPDFLFLHSFMDGELDCDKMDYLLRDSHYCGVTYGQYDLNRFVSTLTAYKVKEENVLQLAIERGGVQALEEFVLARYFMFIQVYFHKTRRYLDKLLVKNMQLVLPDKKYPTHVEDYLQWDDNRALQAISKLGADNAFLNRDVMTCVHESRPHADEYEERSAKIIFDSLRKKYGEKVEYDHVDKEAHKLMPALFSRQDDSGKEIMILNSKTGEIRNIMEESVVLESITRPISIQRLYADKSIRDDVIRDISELLNL